MTPRNRSSSSDIRKSTWLVIGALIVFSLGVELGGDGGRELFRYDRTGLSSGQLWRLLTAHIGHLGWSHSIMNLLALGILGGLFGDLLRGRDWLLSGLIAALAIDAGLWWLRPEVQWYVGMSGVLHGLIIHGALAMVINGERLGMGLLAGVLAKLAWEQWMGPLPFTESTAQGPVLVDAHLYGAVGGLVGASLCVRRGRRAPL